MKPAPLTLAYLTRTWQ